MIEIKNKAFNEIFLSEISNFDSRKYAYDTFFNCDSKRFSKIARQYEIQNDANKRPRRGSFADFAFLFNVNEKTIRNVL